jgi:Protein of unknown function (DUF3726)
VIDLSLNEAEALAAKAARGAGFSWGLADEIGRAARAMATEGAGWSEALLALAGAAGDFEAPDRERIARWRRGEQDTGGARPLCPVRTAALLIDDPADLGAGPLRIAHVGLPIWLGAMLRRSGTWVADVEPRSATGDVTIRRGSDPARCGARRATIAPETLAALNAYAARTYVPESARSRRRGAGGGSVDDD